MSYDIYCYKSKLGYPDEEEMNKVIEDDTDKWSKKDRDAVTKLAIVKALTEYNLRLEAFDFHYGEIAKLTATTIEEARNKFDHIELNAAEGEISIQLKIYDNHVGITVPYWYQGDKAKILFDDIRAYINLIHKTAGYFVFDPQTGEVFNPAEKNFDGLNKYLSISESIEDIIAGAATQSPKQKPWWKFW
jgi:hypothetical protein